MVTSDERPETINYGGGTIPYDEYMQTMKALEVNTNEATYAGDMDRENRTAKEG